MKVLMLIGLLAVLVGCEYIPSKVYKIETMSGEVLNLECPVIDRSRNTFTYMVDGRCRLVTN